MKLKITIRGNDGAKIYFAESVDIHNYFKERVFIRSVVLYTPEAKVKSNMFVLKPGERLFIEEVLK